MSEPTTDDWENIEKGFSERWNFPNCFGALDGKHVVVTAPTASGSTYYNYKGTFSIVLLALVDDKYCFSVIDVGGYGLNSDGGLFKSSALGKKLQNHTLGLPNDKPLPDAPELGSMPYVLVADEAFPLTTPTMHPVPGRGLNDEDRIYNYRLSYARRISENALGILASRWLMYQRKIPLSPENVDSVVRATCVLHNMLQSQN
ncbi:uncharacterized protein LOC135481492 [Liolophura sinensis]|uniref:uncharacterized protein LOC135481492 n=1 Tax=Liolophura sinensis TaxID=3198878 RepID=UPI0031591349